MRRSLQKISLTFVAGCWGGLANGLALWFLGAIGLPQALGVQLAPAITAPWLYQRLVWGGVWGWLFLVPAGLSYPVRGLLYSLGPSLAALLVVLPLQAHKGVLGLESGYLTPVFVLFYNAIWGVVAGWWLTLTERD